MPIVEINDLKQDGIDVYSSLTEQELRLQKEGPLFIAESPKVIRTAIRSGYMPLSLLCERKHIKGDAADIIERYPDLTVYTGSRELLGELTGYKLTRGVLCAMRRKAGLNPEEICRSGRRIGVIEAVCDTTNIGSIFRSAVALGIDGVLLTPDSCDPFNRRSIRVSMGTVFQVKWAFCENPVELLQKNGFAVLALALEKDSLPIDSPELKRYEKIAMVLGTEGDGLSAKTISKCDYKVIIPMFHNVDSLNVGAAAAIAFWEMR